MNSERCTWGIASRKLGTRNAYTISNPHLDHRLFQDLRENLVANDNYPWVRGQLSRRKTR